MLRGLLLPFTNFGCRESVTKQPKPCHLQQQAPLPNEKGDGNMGDLLGVSLTSMVGLDVTFVVTTGKTGTDPTRDQVRLSNKG